MTDLESHVPPGSTGPTHGQPRETAMPLPPDFQQILAAGATTLAAIATRARVLASANPQSPELWLSVRDFEGLAGRLAETDTDEWEEGFAHVVFGGQDLGVLDELLGGHGDSMTSPYGVTATELSALRRARTFLGDYQAGKFTPCNRTP